MIGSVSNFCKHDPGESKHWPLPSAPPPVFYSIKEQFMVISIEIVYISPGTIVAIMLSIVNYTYK